MTVTRRYTFKLYPNHAQLDALQHQAGLCARLWNAALEQREVQWSHECQRKPRGERKGLSQYDQQRELKFIRAADPAYAAMSSSSLELVIKALDLAFKAFFKRAKGGSGASSGYPRYKSAKHADTVPHRDGAGWKLYPHGRHFKIYAKGIPGEIKARGKFPLEPQEIRTMTLIKRDGAWWASIVVYLDERRPPGSLPISVEMDLIDKFAEVKNLTNGQCLPGLTVEKYATERRITQGIPPAIPVSGHVASETKGDDRRRRTRRSGHRGHVASETKGDDRLFAYLATGSVGHVASETKGDDRVKDASALSKAGHVAGETDTIQSEGDRRFKRGSYRWRKNKQRIARLKAKQARQRADRLHNWSAAVIRNACEIQVSAPPVKDLTRSARGTEKNHGAAVETVAQVNRHILEYAPASAIAMLEYKAAEAGIPFAVRTAGDHPAYVGQDISQTAKLERKARKALKRKTS